jgi:hypothetical protein
LEVCPFDVYKRSLLPEVQKYVRARFDNQKVEIAEKELVDVSSLMLELSAVDVAQTSSPKRFTAISGLFGLRPGFAADLEEPKPNGKHWDLADPADVQLLQDMQESQDPILLTGSPPCDPLSVMQHLGKHKRDVKVVADKLAQGRAHLRTLILAYERQMDRGRYFLHEHPWSTSAAKEPEMEKLMNDPRVMKIKGPMCRWDLEVPDPGAPGQPSFVRTHRTWRKFLNVGAVPRPAHNLGIGRFA